MQAGAGTVTARVFVNYKGSDTIEKVPLCNVAHALLRTASEHCCASSERLRTVGGDKVGLDYRAHAVPHSLRRSC